MTHGPGRVRPEVRAEVATREFDVAYGQFTTTLDDLEAAYPDGRLGNAVSAVRSTLEYLNWCVRNRTEDP